MHSHESQFSSSKQEPAGSHGGGPGEEAPAGGAQRRRAESSPGVPPSNTAPGNSKGEGDGRVRLLLHGIDSLYVSFQGQLRRERANELFRLKELAKSPYDRDRCLAIYSHGEHQFSVKSHGSGRFSYVLDDPCYRLSLASVGSKSLPMAYVQFKSAWLTHLGLQAAITELGDIVSRLGEISEGPNVSRADLYVDAVTGLEFESIRRNDWVTRARTIDDYGRSQASTGFVFGRGGDLSVRLYDKTIEILLSGKDYLKPLWSRGGWNGKDSVHRLEAQCCSAFLRQFEISTVESLLANCGALWAYVTGEWLKLVVPNSDDDTRARWPVHPVWTELQAVPWEGVGKAVRCNASPQRVPNDFYLASRGLSTLASFMAARQIDDPLEGAKQQYRHMKDHFDSKAWFEGADFVRIVGERVRMKCRDYGLAHPESIERRDEVLAKAAAEAYRKERDGE